MLEKDEEKPPWSVVALRSDDVKTLWAMWTRLAIRNGLLKRRFESADGLTVKWQVIWPKVLRTEFLQVAHGGTTGGHLGRRRTAAAVQSRAYWPTWSSDLDEYVRQCEPCARCHGGAIQYRAPSQMSRRKKTYDVQMKKAEFNVGDLVWCWYPRRYQKKSPKWQKAYTGPYLIVRVIEPVNYVLQKTARAKAFVVHADKLKRCQGQTPNTWIPGVVNSEPITQQEAGERPSEAATSTYSPPEPVEVPVKTRRTPPLKQPNDVTDRDSDSDVNDRDIVLGNDRPRRTNRKIPARLIDYAC